MPTKLTPINQAVAKQADTPSAGSSQGGYTTHTVAELHVGQPILHQRFGYGTIKQIDTSSDHKIIVDFENLLLGYAKFKIQ